MAKVLDFVGGLRPNGGRAFGIQLHLRDQMITLWVTWGRAVESRETEGSGYFVERLLQSIGQKFSEPGFPNTPMDVVRRDCGWI